MKKLDKAEAENTELLYKNRQLRVFLAAALNFIQQNPDAFKGFLLRNGLVSKLGFTLEDCEGENSLLTKLINSLTVSALEQNNLLIFEKDEDEYGPIVISDK